MRAVVFHEPGVVTLASVPDPAPAADEVIIKVATAGICGTDLHIYRGEYPARFPLIAGHEFTGEVVAAGSAAVDMRVGDRVVVDPNIACGHCAFCRNLEPNHCRNWQAVGVTRNGAFAEYVAAPARVCYRVPDHLSNAQAALIEPLACVVHALNRVRVRPGDDALIFGAGPMGLLLVQALAHSGMGQVVVVEPQPARRALAQQLGATAALPPHDQLGQTLCDLAPHGFGMVVDATGVPAVIEQALMYLRPRGQYLQFGVAPQDATIRLRPYDLFRNDWVLIGSFALSSTFQQAIAWASQGRFKLDALVSHSLPLGAFPAGLEQFAAGTTLKVHVQPGAQPV